MGTDAIGSTATVTVVSANTKSASDLLAPMNTNETTQARGYLELVQRGRPSRPGNGPHIPRVPPRRPDFPRHDPFPRDPFPRDPFPRYPLPIPIPVPRWPSPMPWPNSDLRPCLPGEIPDYYDRYGRALCRSWWW